MAQVTGSYRPAVLRNTGYDNHKQRRRGNAFTGGTTAGSLLFTGGILNTGRLYHVCTRAFAAAVTGAGATAMPDGTAYKNNFPAVLTSVNYEVGDIDYAPMTLSA